MHEKTFGNIEGMHSKQPVVVLLIACIGISFFLVYYVEARVRANTQKRITRQETRGVGERSTK